MTLSLSLDVRLAHLECITLCTKAQLRRGQGVHWGQTFPARGFSAALLLT